MFFLGPSHRRQRKHKTLTLASAMAYFSSTNWSQYRNVHDAHIGYLSEEKGSRSKGPLFISVVIGTVH